MKKVLIVDDDQIALRIYEKSLKNFGYEVYTASDGMAALDMMYKHKIDLLVLDLNMPFMGGFQLLDKMSKNPRFENIIKTVVTGLNSDEDRARAKALGVEGYFTKPVNMRVIAERLNELFCIKDAANATV
jgi:CheY-like chemotaxis protein